MRTVASVMACCFLTRLAAAVAPAEELSLHLAPSDG